MKTKSIKKQILIFLAIAFGLNYLMAIPLYLAKSKGLNIDVFPLLSMSLPASGVAIAALRTRKEDKKLPIIFYGILISNAFVLFLLCFAVFYLDSKLMYQLSNLSIIILSAMSWTILMRKKFRDNHRAYGLSKGILSKVILVSLLFVLIYLLRMVIGLYINGDSERIANLLSINLIYKIPLIIISFFLSYLPFLGEEYAWRYYFQPILEKRFGMIKGVLILGFLWGLWHLPLNLFYYSAKSMAVLSLSNQIVNCMTLSIFMAYAYNKTKSIWAPVLIHYLNNTLLILPFNQNELDGILKNQTYEIRDILFILVFGLIFFGLFALTKYVKDKEFRMPTMNEMADNYTIK